MFPCIITKNWFTIEWQNWGYKQMERMMIPFFMQRTLISTTIHVAKISLAQVTNKQNGRNPKQKKNKKRLKKKGWANYALSDTAPVFPPLAPIPFMTLFLYPTKQKFASFSCHNNARPYKTFPIHHFYTEILQTLASFHVSNSSFSHNPAHSNRLSYRVRVPESRSPSSSLTGTTYELW